MRFVDGKSSFFKVNRYANSRTRMIFIYVNTTRSNEHHHNFEEIRIMKKDNIYKCPEMTLSAYKRKNNPSCHSLFDQMVSC